jgi:hypothetical protein
MKGLIEIKRSNELEVIFIKIIELIEILDKDSKK